MVSKAWKELSDQEREEWEEIARKDKARYEMEKATYKGPWKVAAKGKFPKDHEAPKKPMSAYLSFSNLKRAEVKAKHPSADNSEISRILAQMWKDATDDERNEYVEKEHLLRQEYKTDMAEWSRRKEMEYQTTIPWREDSSLSTSDYAYASYDGGVPPSQDYLSQGQLSGGTVAETDPSQPHYSIPQSQFHGCHYQGFPRGSSYYPGTVPPFYPHAPVYYHPDYYMHRGEHADQRGDYTTTMYPPGVYPDSQSSYAAQSSAAHQVSNEVAAYDPSGVYRDQQQELPTSVTSYPYFGQDYQYPPPPEGSHAMYPPQPYPVYSTTVGHDDSKEQYSEPEPSPLSASRDIFSSSFHDDQADDSPNHLVRRDLNPQQQNESLVNVSKGDIEPKFSRCIDDLGGTTAGARLSW